MDKRTGEIFNTSTMCEDSVMLSADEYRELKPLDFKQRKNRMRNKPCHCGSGKKFKRCCW